MKTELSRLSADDPAPDRADDDDVTPLPDRYAVDPREGPERCPQCDRGFVYHDEEVRLEPRYAVFVCMDHFVAGDGECSGTAIKVYEDGFVTRSVFGSATTG